MEPDELDEDDRGEYLPRHCYLQLVMGFMITLVESDHP